MDFLNYLATNNGFPTSQYLTVLEAGSEPFIGTSVTLSTSQYTIDLNVDGADTSDTAQTAAPARRRRHQPRQHPVLALLEPTVSQSP
jgi:hypothetical protein